MASPETRYRFYGDLARWWHLISPAAEYAEEAGFAMSLLVRAAIPVREVLELGSGGGHNAVHLKDRFAMTLVDLSDEMLEVSQMLNPDSDHHQGDMRTVRLGREFDAVFVHDAVDYMTSEADLRQAMETAFVHCRPGGLVLFAPDNTLESFQPGTDHGGNDAADGRGVRYLEWDWDPDPEDTSTSTEYVFVLRERRRLDRSSARDPPHGTFWPGRLDAAPGRSRIRPGGRHGGDHGGASASRILHRPAKQGSG